MLADETTRGDHYTSRIFHLSTKKEVDFDVKQPAERMTSEHLMSKFMFIMI